uniref:Uncharacterized protein n=1 Tax=Anopheles merus TaxID=30066 RepID=A0A182VGJ9_ANOME
MNSRRCRWTTNGSFASCITKPSMTCVSTFGLIVAFGMPPLSALLAVFGGNPLPVEPVEAVVTQDVAVEPDDDTTLPFVESKPFEPMLLTGIADVPVTVAIAVVAIVDVAVVEVVLLSAPPPVVTVVVVVLVEELEAVATEAVVAVDSFAASSAAPAGVVAVVEFTDAVAAMLLTPAPLLTVVMEVGTLEAKADDTADAIDDWVRSPLIPFALLTVVAMPGAGVVSIGVLAVPFNCASVALLSVAGVPVVSAD